MIAAKLFLWVMFMALPCIARYCSLDTKQQSFGAWFDSEGFIIAICAGLVSGSILCVL